MVIEQFTNQGTMPPELLYSSPYTDIAPTGPEAVFGIQRANAIFERIEAVNMSAIA
ncbi:MAG: hypothetical protein K9G60_00365 [Pseudolabrys sp.]|nr:hypothetical protein [Pseudolabrys sp.]